MHMHANPTHAPNPPTPQTSGHWCDAVDPRTGLSMRPPHGQRYDEVVGAELLLGYVRQQLHGNCPMITHPAAGSQVYPATLFTTAPLGLLRDAVAGADAAAAAAAFGAETGSQLATTAAAASYTQQQHDHYQPHAAGPPPSPAWAWPAPAVLTVKGLCLSTRAGAPVVRGLGFQLPAGSSLLISGPTGAGKSTLLRVLAGLWRADAGSATLPGPRRGGGGGGGGAVFAPQRPLAAAAGTLREQLVYPDACNMTPHTHGNVPGGMRKAGASGRCDRGGGSATASSAEAEDVELLGLLHAVGLGALPGRMGATLDAPCVDWGAALSPGELQRLAFARTLNQSPALALLDEPTSALAADDEAALFGLLAARGVAVVTVGHRRSLAALHRLELAIAGDGSGGWELGPTAAGR
jgi:ABC-type uncharacterized transport system fused permease/ATPase subunit